jgi:hypothetical protein
MLCSQFNTHPTRLRRPVLPQALGPGLWSQLLCLLMANLDAVDFLEQHFLFPHPGLLGCQRRPPLPWGLSSTPVSAHSWGSKLSPSHPPCVHSQVEPQQSTPEGQRSFSHPFKQC